MEKQAITLLLAIIGVALAGCGERNQGQVKESDRSQPAPAASPVPGNETTQGANAAAQDATGGNPPANPPITPTPHGDGRAPEPSGKFQ